MQLGERSWLYVAAVFAHAAEQPFSHPAGTAFVAAGIAPLPLENPLKTIVDDPPVFIELRYEPRGGVREGRR